LESGRGDSSLIQRHGVEAGIGKDPGRGGGVVERIYSGVEERLYSGVEERLYPDLGGVAERERPEIGEVIECCLK